MRFHPDDHSHSGGKPDSDGACPGSPGEPEAMLGAQAVTPYGGRLNLLLSYAGWQVESWVDCLPRLLEPMGVVSHRAETGREATEVIRRQPIHIAVVDLGLPLEMAASAPHNDEGGARLLEILSRLSQPPPTVVVKRSRTHRDDCREIAAALRAGAFAVVDRPRSATDVEMMLEVLRRCLTRFYHGQWPRIT